MWRRNIVFGCFCLIAIVIVISYVMPRRKFADDHRLISGTTVDEAGQTVRPVDMQPIVDELDRLFQQQWQEQGLTPAPPVDGLALARRMSLGLTGTIPSLEEIKQIDQLTSAEIGDRWLEYLLTDRRYGDHVAERLARALVGTEEGPFLIFRRRRFVSWLSDQLMENVPYDQLVYQIVTSSGLWTDSPGVNFLTVTTNEELEGRPDPVRLAGRTTRAFLGVRLDCMQCHDDNLEGAWLQSDFIGWQHSTTIPRQRSWEL